MPSFGTYDSGPYSLLGLAELPSAGSRLYRGPFGELLAVAQMNAQLDELARRAPMGALDDFLNGVSKVGGAILGGLEAAIGVGQRIGVLPGPPVQGPVWTMAPTMGGGPGAMMMNGSANAAPGSFQAACAADPTGQCQAAIWAALQGTVPGMGGGGAIMNEDAMLAALGFPPALIMAIKNIPGAVGRLLGGPAGQIAIGVGSGIAGAAAGSALLGGGPRLPRRIQVPDGRGGVREYVSRGRPVLYSGDITAARRVRKVAARARRTSPRGRRSVGQAVIALQGGVHNVCGKCLSSPCGCS